MALANGARLGPYEVLGLVGAGGMGEVYRARDPRLGRDVAVKIITTDGPPSAERLRRFEDEARAVASLSHPNVLTVFDAGERDGEPYVVFELLDGESLRERLRKGPLSLRSAVETVVQACCGLQAAHARGILHRDLKPENLFLTSDGFVKILDFGLAKLTRGEGADTGARRTQTVAGVVMGTPGYLSPEQARGREADARSDIFALGAILYEALSGRRAFSGATAADTISAILHGEPPPLQTASGPLPGAVERVVRRCLAKEPEDRFYSAHDLALALEAALERPLGTGVDDGEARGPYPGLSAFTEADAGRFFGREGEVEAVWERIRSRRLLAVIGPSGAGKTSFVRAGVVASRPEAWAAVVTTPGSSPLLMLGQALAPELAGDRLALRQLVRFEDPEAAFEVVLRWRKAHAEALLVVDQAEELFTLNSKDTQARFAAFLGRLAKDGDVHVLLSLRDDFLMRCGEHEGLVRVFTELTPLLPMGRDALRRALMEPARREGYRFEDDALVEEMTDAVEGERGALPLLAFAVARLWEKRDRERKLLTHAAYGEIGGIEGALAQHAEATMDAIGPERHAIVRDIFRNLVTAQGTRAVIDREELLSAFPDRSAAEDVLRQLIDARLLTTYEVEGKEGEPSHHRVEVVHESLLKAWPRLVRWQAQDEEGALLRDQLKQAAHLWEERGRTSDLLWTGTAFREFELWRERYPGALTALEEDFARALADKARRKRRIIRAAVAAVVLVSTGVSVAIAVSRHQAVVAAQRAEASKLLALAQLKLQEDPTEALAYATASLELADTKEARLMALRALQEAPPAWEVPSEISQSRVPAFSPDGHHLAVGGHTAEVGVWADDGSPPLRLPGHETSPSGNNSAAWASTEMLVTGLCCGLGQRVHVWSLPGGTKLRTIDFGRPSRWQVGPGRLFAQTPEGAPGESFVGGGLLRSWRLPDGEPEVLGHVDARKLGITSSFFDPHGRAWLYTKGATIHTVPLPVDLGADRVFSRHGANVEFSDFLGPDLLALHDESGENRLLRFPENGPPVVAVLPKPGSAPAEVVATFSARFLRGDPTADAKLRLWDTTAFPGARPLELRREGSWRLSGVVLDPVGRIAVVSTHDWKRLTFWPLPARWPSVVDWGKYPRLAFSPDSRWLATATVFGDRQIRLWPLPGTGSSEARTFSLPPDPPPGRMWDMAFDPRGRYLIASTCPGDNTWIVPLDGSRPQRLSVDSSDNQLYPFAFSPTGRYVARAVDYGRGPKTLRVWDVEAGVLHVFDSPVTQRPPGSTPRVPTGYEGGIFSLAFLDDSTLYTAGDGGVRRWNLETGAHVLVKDSGREPFTDMTMSDDRRAAFTQSGPLEPGCAPLERLDLATGVSTPLPRFGDCPQLPRVAGPLLASASADGILVVRASRVSEREAHLFPGKFVTVTLAISPDLKWLASASEDKTLRLWPMPDLDQPPLHTLPHDELVAKLKSLTNLRAVRDAKSATGWSIELGPFPGWRNIPAW